METLTDLWRDEVMTTTTPTPTPTPTPIPTATPGRRPVAAAPPTLVVGGRGKTGRRVASRLAARGIPVRIGSRTGDPAFDWNDPAGWPAALVGIRHAYVTYHPDVTVPGAVDHIRRFGAVARTAGLERLVLLSGRGEPAAQASEDALLDCGIDTTVVRCAFFAQNFNEYLLVEPVQQGVIALPAGDVTEPIIDVDDIADVVVTALTSPGHEGRVLELTGPELLTFHDIAATLSQAAGRTVTYRPLTPEQYRQASLDEGMPPDLADMLTDLFAHIFDGHNSALTDTVAEVLGRPARSFAAFAHDAAATGVWDLPSGGAAR